MGFQLSLVNDFYLPAQLILSVHYATVSVTKDYSLNNSLSNMCCFLCRKAEGKDNPLVEQFIARKADILFCPSWKTATHQEGEHEEEEAAGGCFHSDVAVLSAGLTSFSRNTIRHRILRVGLLHFSESEIV